MRRRRNAQGFTLVELMVVVAILGILAAVAVPLVLRIVAKKRTQLASMKKSVAVAQEALKIQQVVQTRKGKRLLRRPLHAVRRSEVKLALQVSYQLDRGKVVPVYEARYEGHYLLHNSTRRPFVAQVHFPFPAGAGTFSDLQFLVSPRRKVASKRATSAPTSRPVAPKKAALIGTKLAAPRYDVRMTPQGVTWLRKFAAGERVNVLIRYRVRGRDKYRYRIAPGKKKLFRFALTVQGVDPTIPSHALKPSAAKRLLGQEGREYRWDFRDFLTTEDIEVHFPLEYSKYYRFALLGKLAGLSLLLFAFFFWFFGERQHPDKITRPNFALLNLGFVSFYPLFIYLDDHVSMAAALGIALFTSTALTTAHTSTFMGIRWALLRSLPLQLFFVVGFTFAVLFPTYRPLTFTAGGVILTALVIVIHARYQREKEREEQARKEAEEERKLRLAKASQEAAVEMGLSLSVSASSPSTLTVSAKESVAPASPAEEKRHCLFCGVTVERSHKHCFDCGSQLQRTHNCSQCECVYWYPSVESFRYCRECGGSLFAPPSPLKALSHGSSDDDFS